ncbi:MAG TPA: prepilin peptidase, partial [Urbifossiella sp.]
MSTQLMTPPISSTAPAGADDSLGIDRALVVQLARMPLLALLWVGAAFASHQIWALFAPEGLNYGPLIVICAGMVLAAFVDGWAYKVPNWVTLPLILSGWMIGGLHSGGFAIDGGTGSFASSIACTFLGFALLFPMLAIGGVGVG